MRNSRTTTGAPRDGAVVMGQEAAEVGPLPAGAQAGGGAGRAGAALLAVLVAGQFIAILDVSIVNVAAPVMRSDLGASGAGLQWVVAGYTIAYAMLLITGSRLGGIFGFGRAYLAGVSLFTLASLACGLATSTAELIVFRCLQGTGAALLVPQVLTLIQRRFTGRRRTTALGLYQASVAGGAVLGQVLGGVLVGADVLGTGWRPVFLVNVPFGIAIVLIGRRELWGDRPEPVGGSAWGRLDMPGVAVLVPAMLALVVPLVMGHESGWPVWGWVLLAAGIAGLGVFAGVERRVARRGGSPLVPGVVVRSPGLVPAAVALLSAVGTWSAMLFVSSLHLQSGLGSSALRAGLTFVPCALGFGVSGLLWGRLPESVRSRAGHAGFLLVAVSLAGMAFVWREGDGGGVALQVALVGMGLGQGAVIGPLLGRALGRVRAEHAGDASGVVVTCMQLGGVLGLATYGTLYLSRTGSGANVSGDAIAVTLAVMAGVNLFVGCCLGIADARRRRTEAGPAVA